jgi:predicted nucleic acid-binding protein
VILADTSAWVEYDRATGSRVDERMAALVGETETLAGARDDRSEADLRRLLDRFRLLRFDPGADFHGAVRIYRSCRQAGVTPRGLLDCLIASVAIRHQVALLTADRDLARIATVMDLQLDPASV